MYDLIIIGAGPAGITAAVYAARKGLDFIIITKDIGGQTVWSSSIDNYTGYQLISGPELADKFEEHMRKYTMNVKDGEEVLELTKRNDKIVARTSKSTYEAKTAIIASGKKSKELGVVGEVQFKNKGLTYCATCDGPLFEGKDVAVMGGGNSALDATLQLINIANHIYLINISKRLTGDAVMKEKVKKSDKVTILNDTRVTAIKGDKFVRSIAVKTKDVDKELSVEGVFVEIGLIPNSGFAKDVGRNRKNEIKVNCYNQTDTPGIFAAGDVTDVPEKQIIVAAGEGAKAALGIFRYLAKQK
ncbi:MAG: FAD-dependent oxidoreductase [bacterium]